MALMIFRDSFVNHLSGSVRDYAPRYRRDEAWTDEVPGGLNSSIATRVNAAAPLELVDPETDDLKDTENAIRLHKALPSLTSVQARDPRLWTRLAHVEFWSYMRQRWNIGKSGHDQAKVQRLIQNRYFVTQNQSRALLRHGIARLWWAGRVTYDPTRSNPYELTAVLLKSLDITQTILERNLGRVPQLLTGFLEFLLQNAELLESGGESRTRIRQLAKFLNLEGGVTILDSLTKSEIVAMLAAEHARLDAVPVKAA